MDMRAIAWLGLLGLTLQFEGRARAADPDVLVLTSGERVSGTLLETHADGVKLQFPNGEKLFYPRTIVAYAGATDTAPQPGFSQPVFVETNRPGLLILERPDRDRGRTPAERRAFGVLGMANPDLPDQQISLCQAPCRIALEPRAHALVVKRDLDGPDIDVEPTVVVAGPTTVRVEYVDRARSRSAANLTLAAAILAGVAVMASGGDGQHVGRILDGTGVAGLGFVAWGLIWAIT
jgi:hypothetical protein